MKRLEHFMRHVRKNASFPSFLSELNLTDLTKILKFSRFFVENGSQENPFPPHQIPPSSTGECDTLLEFLDLFHAFYIPALIGIGLIGNFLSCLVFLSTHLRMRSSSYYLAALATADFGFLLCLLCVWINDTSGIRIFNKSGWCQCLVYSSSVCSFLSVWLIVAFTVERFIAVQYPLHRPHMCTVERAKFIILSLVLFALLSHSYSFITAGMIRVDGDLICDMKEEYAETMRVINIVDSLMTLIIPLILIVFMNCMITRNLIKFNKQFRVSSCTPGRSSRNEFSLCRLTRASSIHGRRHTDSSDSQESGLARTKSFRFLRAFSSTPRLSTFTTKAQQNITKMLLVISTVFIILNLPSYVIRLYAFVFYSLWRRSTPEPVWCAQQLFMVFYYTNFSVNFLLYSMYGATFRRCLWQMLKSRWLGILRLLHPRASSSGPP